MTTCKRGGNLRFRRGLAKASVLLAIILAVGLVVVAWDNVSLRRQNASLQSRLQSLEQKYSIIESQLSFYKSQAQYYASLLQSIGNKTVLGNSTINLVAVREVKVSPLEARYEGVTLKAVVELRPGAGDIYINTRPIIGIDLQLSARTAVLVAQKLTGISLGSTDVFLTIIAETQVDIVDGPSAGGAITVAMMAAIQNKTIDQTVYITGTINPDGTIGPVGAVLEKALTAAQEGATAFLVPPGQRVTTVWKEYTVGFLVLRYAERVDIQKYLDEEGYDVRVVEVGTIGEAYELMIASE